ncbi:helix-turn-helix domain-containing protein [Leifsonia aquatica]|uniref:helix-turn-helix domain-containing protein n=1 Tax=Leifsonia aquatica TaxID=144185 RepID=UPI00046A6B31|nr:helix-turn-helix domain-containing protein [Leifsonia aquatica]
MSVTIELPRTAAEPLSFAPSPLAELSAAMHLLVEPTHHPTQNGWVTATTAATEPQLLDRLIDADFLWRTSRADMLLPADPGPTLADELDAMDRLDDETWVSAALLTSSCGTIPLFRELGSPLVDPAARRLARERAQARGPRQLGFVDVVLDDPGRARSRVRRLLEDCDAAFFSDVWAGVKPQLVDDARRMSDLLATAGVARVLEAVSPAITVDAERHCLVVDKLQDSATTADDRGVVFLPSVFGHPHVLVVHAPGWRPVIQYPSTGGRTPQLVPVEVVQQRLHALDHPVRLRLARSLLRGPHTTADLAEAWGLTAPEVSRHLAALRDAGIVTATRRGRYVEYELEVATTTRLGRDLVESLLR